MTGSSTTLRGAIAIERGGNYVDRRRVGQHADLHRADIEIGEHGIDLRRNEIGGHVMDGEHALGILRRERGDDAGAIDPERGKGFQIRLDAGAAARIRAGDGQGDGNAHFLDSPIHLTFAGRGGVTVSLSYLHSGRSALELRMSL
jgi:hypothetical protein